MSSDLQVIHVINQKSTCILLNNQRSLQCETKTTFLLWWGWWMVRIQIHQRLQVIRKVLVTNSSLCTNKQKINTLKVKISETNSRNGTTTILHLQFCIQALQLELPRISSWYYSALKLPYVIASKAHKQGTLQAYLGPYSSNCLLKAAKGIATKGI